MKFIKISEHTKEFFQDLKRDPSSLGKPLQEHMAWMRQMKDEGKLIDAYFMPGDGRCISIWEFENETDVDNCILQDPMELEFTCRILPAVPLFTHMDNAMNRKE